MAWQVAIGTAAPGGTTGLAAGVAESCDLITASAVEQKTFVPVLFRVIGSAVTA
jgi:hypothetical protein